MLETEPRDDLKNVRAVFGSGPNTRVRHAAASFTCEVTETGVLLPLTVNGRRVNWLLDNRVRSRCWFLSNQSVGGGNPNVRQLEPDGRLLAAACGSPIRGVRAALTGDANTLHSPIVLRNSRAKGDRVTSSSRPKSNLRLKPSELPRSTNATSRSGILMMSEEFARSQP
jgi:hypothetical protein